jgi:hypothetical protein
MFTKAPPVDGLPAGSPRGKEAQSLLAGEMLSAWRDMQVTMTEFIERLGGRAVNHILKAATTPFDANGTVVLSFGSPAGAITVRAGAHAVTIASGSNSGGGNVPTQGVGVWVVPPNSRDTVPIAARELVLYGTVAELVSYVAYTTGPAPTSG